MDARRREATARQILPGAPDAPAGDPVTAGLRHMFDLIAQEPIPEDFLRLLDEIDARASEMPSVGDAGDGSVSLPGNNAKAPKPGASR